MPELTRNILYFGCGINFKYEEMLSYSFNRFYVAIKLILPTITFDLHCNYLNVDLDKKISSSTSS